MNKLVIRNIKDAGFDKQADLVQQGKCPFCQKEIKIKDFKDIVSKKEYNISGLCQKCQDEIFREKKN